MTAKLFNTIKKRKDFLTIAKSNQRFFGNYFLLQTLPNNQLSGIFRVGYVATRRVGNAVKRNKSKRRLRELVRQYQSEFMLNTDYVLIARHNLWSASFELLKKDFIHVIHKVSAQTTVSACATDNCVNTGVPTAD
jgi:ribonuclease P protein component